MFPNIDSSSMIRNSGADGVLGNLKNRFTTFQESDNGKMIMKYKLPIIGAVGGVALLVLLIIITVVAVGVVMIIKKRKAAKAGASNHLGTDIKQLTGAHGTIRMGDKFPAIQSIQSTGVRAGIPKDFFNPSTMTPSSAYYSQ